MRSAYPWLESLSNFSQMEVCSLQEYHRHAPKIKIVKRER